MILAVIILAAAWAASLPSWAQTAPSTIRIVEASSDRLQIVDGDDVLNGVLVPELDPDIYVVHPSIAPKPVSVITDRGRIDLTVGPGETYDFAIRYRGRLYNQRITSIDPSPPSYGGAADRPGGVDVVPFRLGPNNAIHIGGSLNGSPPLDFIFDTGASIGVLTEAGRAKGAAFTDGETNRIAIGEIAIDALPLLFIDYSGTLRADGVIGYDAFADKVVEIDHDAGILRIHHDRPDPTGYARTAIVWRGGSTLVPLTLEADGITRTVHALLDTGSKWSVTLNHRDPLAEDLGGLRLEGLRRGRKSDGSTLWLNVVELPAVSFAGHRVTGVQADVARSATGASLPHNIVGNDFLKRFDLLIDYRSSEVYARPNGLAAERYNPVMPLWIPLAAVGAALGALVLFAVVMIRRRGRPKGIGNA